jgi:hypothetical protein
MVKPKMNIQITNSESVNRKCRISMCPSDRKLMIQNHVGNSQHLPLVTVPFKTNKYKEGTVPIIGNHKFTATTRYDSQNNYTFELPSTSRTAYDITYEISNCPSHEGLMIQNHGNE